MKSRAARVVYFWQGEEYQMTNTGRHTKNWFRSSNNCRTTDYQRASKELESPSLPDPKPRSLQHNPIKISKIGFVLSIHPTPNPPKTATTNRRAALLTKSNICFNLVFQVSAITPQPAAAAPEHQDATRARLIDAAAHVFAEHGFQAATVRDICTRAGANIAAVNYHFRDKAGLYLAVLRHSMNAGGQPEPREIAANAATPEDALRLMISSMLRRMHGPATGPACHFRIMVHEMVQPTEALPRIVEEIIGPNHAAMRQILSRLLGKPPDDDVTRLCAHSIVGQVVHYAHAGPMIALLWPDLRMTPERLDAIATHISEFSLSAIQHFRDQHFKETTSHE
jgi:AcrR family transcriptional regulator